MAHVASAQTYDEDVVMKACSCIYHSDGDSIDSIVNSCLMKALLHSLAEDGITKEQILRNISKPVSPENLNTENQTTFGEYLEMLYRNCSATRYLIEKYYPEGHKALLDLGASYLSKGDSQNALSTYAKLIRYYPDNPDGYFGLGFISFSNGDYATTARLMKHAHIIYSAQQSNRVDECKEYLKASYYYMKEAGNDSVFASIAGEFIPPVYQPENFNQLQYIELNNAIDCRLAEPQILVCSNYILSTPVKDSDINRSFAIAAVKKWMAKTPDYIFHVDKNVAKILDVKGNVLAVFITAMTKFCIENPEQGNDSQAVASYAWDTVLYYAAKKENNVQLTRELKKMIKAKQKGERVHDK